MDDFKVINNPPSVEDYMKLRDRTTLSSRDIKSVVKGINNCWFGVHIQHRGETIAMGRIVGDGGTTFQIVDVAVLPEFQGKGIGRMIMKALMTYYNNNAPVDAYLSLMADGNAKHLYKKFGFEETAPTTVGMKYTRSSWEEDVCE